MDIRTILVPVDFSEHAEKALTWALALAEQRRARLILFHVVSVPTPAPIVLGIHFNLTDFEAALLEDAKAKAKEFVARSGSKTAQLEAKVISGQPFPEICRVAEQEKADLIVMGSHGRTGLSHVLLGSVAERVVRHASCPVLVVGKKAQE